MIVDFKQYSQLTEYVPLLPDIPKSADANRLSFVKGGILGFWDSQKSRKGNITYFFERAGRMFREDIKVCKMCIHKNFSAAPGQKKIIS